MLLDNLTDNAKTFKLEGFSNVANFIATGNKSINDDEASDRTFWVCSKFDVIFTKKIFLRFSRKNLFIFFEHLLKSKKDKKQRPFGIHFRVRDFDRRAHLRKIHNLLKVK